MAVTSWRPISSMLSRLAAGVRPIVEAGRAAPSAFRIAYLLVGFAAATGAFAGWADGRASLQPWPVLGLWLASIALLLGGARLFGAPAATRDRFGGWEWLAIGGITTVAAVARLVALGHLPSNFSGDEGEMGIRAREVLTGDLPDPFTSGWLGHPRLWFYLQAGALRVFGDNPQGLRTLSALFGAAAIPALYLFARKPFGRRVALAAAALLATYHVHIHFSRIGVNNVADPLVALLGFTAFLEACRRRSPYLFALAGVLLGLDQHLYFAGRMAPLVLLGVLTHMALWQRRRLVSIARFLPLLVLGFFVALGPLIRLPLLHWSDFTARLAIEGVFGSGWYHDRVVEGSSPVAVLAGQMWHGFGAFGFLDERGPTYNVGMPILDPFSTALFVAGVGILVMRIRSAPVAVVLLWLLGAAIGTALLVGGPGSEHYVTVAPVICLVIAVAIDTVAGGLQLIRHPKIVRAGGVAAAVVVLGAWSLNFYFHSYSPRNTYGFAPTETASEVARFIAPRARDSYAYLLVTNLSLKNGTIRFLARGAQGVDALDTPVDRLPAPPAGLGAVFIVSPDRSDTLQSIERLYPGGRLQMIRQAQSETVLFTAYTVGPDAGVSGTW